MRDNYLCVQNILAKIAPIERARESDRFRLSKLEKISKGGKVRSKRRSTQKVALRCTLFLVRDIILQLRSGKPPHVENPILVSTFGGKSSVPLPVHLYFKKKSIFFLVVSTFGYFIGGGVSRW